MTRFFAAFVILTLITVLLLGVTVQFFSAAPVKAQINAWVSSLTHGSTTGSTDPQVTATAPIASRTPAAVPTSTPGPGDEPPRFEQVQEPGRIVPTTPPIIQVIEVLPPDGNLVIPSLGIDQPLIPVRVRDQVWDVEELGTEVGWLQTTGAHPRDDLAMVLIGHITLPYPGGSGPFLYLNRLQPGDVIKYRDWQETYTYNVKSLSVIKPEEVENLYRPGGDRLLLVTCTGYNAIEWRYDLRLIVEAELVSVEKNGFE